MTHVPRRRVMPTALTAARWMAWLGLACGAVYAVGGLVYDLATVGLNPGTALAFLALAGMPMLFGAVGFVAGGVVALAARLVDDVRGRA